MRRVAHVRNRNSLRAGINCRLKCVSGVVRIEPPPSGVGRVAFARFDLGYGSRIWRTELSG